MDGGTTFESRFQYAKSLKEGGDLLLFLEEGGGHEIANEYYQKVRDHADIFTSDQLLMCSACVFARHWRCAVS